MTFAIKKERLKSYKDLALLLLKYGRTSLVKNVASEDVLEEKIDAEDLPSATELAKDLESLGPTYIKLGQLLSTRGDLLPAEYLEELSRLQDEVAPFSFAEVEQILQQEIGMRVSKAFQDLEAEPIAAASLGQVHRGILRDGRLVAVKVQRPNIRTKVLEDLRVISEVASFLDKHSELGNRFRLNHMVDEFRLSLLRELDYLQEARNLRTLNENLKEFQRIVVPSPIADYTTSIVLTMEYVEGKKITDLGPLARNELQGKAIAEEFYVAYLKQIFVDGFFHADPHPGNVFLTEDGRIALIDLGMIGHLTMRLQETLLQLVLAISEGRSEDATDFAMKMSERRDDFDELTLKRHINALLLDSHNLNLHEMEVGKTLMRLVRLSANCGLMVPPELTMLGKALLSLDQVGQTLDPHFDPNSCVRSYGAEITRRRMMKSMSMGNAFAKAIEVKDFLEQLPVRINRLLDSAANNQLQLKVDAFNETRLIEGLQKIANRIAMGVVLAALIIGAAMLMRVQTKFTILGYPALGILLFLMAAFGGLLLVISILWQDHQTRK